MTTFSNSKGQIIIPAKLRKKLNIKKGTRFAIKEDNGKVILQPITAAYIEKMSGCMDFGGKGVTGLLEDRAREKEHEDNKWHKS